MNAPTVCVECAGIIDETGCCQSCGLEQTEPCPDCGAHGLHTDDCRACSRCGAPDAHPMVDPWGVTRWHQCSDCSEAMADREAEREPDISEEERYLEAKALKDEVTR